MITSICTIGTSHSVKDVGPVQSEATQKKMLLKSGTGGLTMDELKSCPFCGNTKIGIVRSKQNGVPSGDDGWCAKIKCKCGADMKFLALKKSWAEETAIKAWNRRADNG